LAGRLERGRVLAPRLSFVRNAPPSSCSQRLASSAAMRGGGGSAIHAAHKQSRAASIVKPGKGLVLHRGSRRYYMLAKAGRVTRERQHNRRDENCGSGNRINR